MYIYKNYDFCLMDGKDGLFEGCVEVYCVGFWGMICDDCWDNDDVYVVCR